MIFACTFEEPGASEVVWTMLDIKSREHVLDVDFMPLAMRAACVYAESRSDVQGFRTVRVKSADFDEISFRVEIQMRPKAIVVEVLTDVRR